MVCWLCGVLSSVSLIVNKTAIYVRVMEICLQLLDANVMATKRDIYYRDVALFKHQRTVDAVVEDLACTLGIPRSSLNVVASSKGLIYGNLRLLMKDGSVVDCLESSEQGGLIPPSESISAIETDAQFVLVAEKEATFRTLLQLRVAEKYGPCVIMTGKGYPDVSTRMLVKRLSEFKAELTQHSDMHAAFFSVSSSSQVDDGFEDGHFGNPWLDSQVHVHQTVSMDFEDSGIFQPDPAGIAVEMFPEPIEQIKDRGVLPPSLIDGHGAPQWSQGNTSAIPIYALVDCDPHGLEIFLCYKSGSKAMAFDRDNLACPSLHWLGVRPSDWSNPRYGIDTEALLPLTPRDRRKALGMLKRPYVRDCPDIR
ncbi:Spo11/DNA topoisomerase VI subunit A [Fimicolochytrium jonesii]|uniref:Spo11/DNA topoisomerase VI subunit A n=1 Tax=Fimicolochytrium jonesii TaxID=1396493 RepID=UPI0022FEE49A|nr:Spo11/DNA topoisomerase VI subunit A [Fimicolochytrium jonesii]KAI8817375.1 Spo11/DNA topoisomerase VI subunit A [Fimicolochytrium jonesii]